MANLTDIYKKASLVMKPAAMKEGKLYSQQPHSGAGDFTFSRANGVQTRINEHGLIESVADNTPRLSYDLVTKEEARTNNILYSEDFTNSVWQKLGGGTGIAPTVTANYATAPNGEQTADRVVMDMGGGTTGDNFSIIRNFGISGSTGTNSVYIKSNTSDSYTIGIDNVGTVEMVTVTPQWQRFSYSDTNSDRLQISLRGTGGSTSRYADVSMWGGSLEIGTYLTSYIPTEGDAVTIPAVVVASECPTLLLEPTSTNIITRSRELTSGDLVPVSSTISDNENIIDPTGKNDAKTLTATSTSQPRLEWRGTSVPSSDTNYTMSFFVRYNTARYVAIGHFSQHGEYAIFDLVDGKVEADGGTQTAKIEAHPNGWYRVSKTFEVLSTASFNYWKLILCTQTNPFVGVSGEKADVFGLQFESSSYATSYIPTEGSTEVRAADSVQINDFANAPTDYPFTIFCDFDLVKTGQKSFMFSFLWSGASNNYFAVGYNVDGGGNFFKFENRAQGNVLGTKTTSTYTQGRYKLAIKFVSSTNLKAFIDGVEVANHTHTAISFNSFIKDFILGQLRTVGDTGDRTPIHQFMLFNEALSDSELITLTT